MSTLAATMIFVGIGALVGVALVISGLAFRTEDEDNFIVIYGGFGCLVAAGVLGAHTLGLM